MQVATPLKLQLGIFGGEGTLMDAHSPVVQRGGRKRGAVTEGLKKSKCVNMMLRSCVIGSWLT